MTPNEVSVHLLTAVREAAIELVQDEKIDHVELTIGVADMLGEMVALVADPDERAVLLQEVLQRLASVTGFTLAIARARPSVTEH